MSKRLAERHVRGLDFYRLDVNWADSSCSTAARGPRSRGSKPLPQQKLPFSLIYWASGYPALKRRGLADDSTWYVSLLRQGYDYAMVQGEPDH